MSTSLKKEILELLEKDVEFRYAVAGYLGLSEVLRRLDGIEESMERLWKEMKNLREDQNRLWEGQSRIWENIEKLWEEVKMLREGQEKLWEEVKNLREDQNKLWEGQKRLWKEVKSLREGQDRLWRIFRSFLIDFRELGRAVGMTLDYYTAAFLRMYLEDRGYPAEKIDIGVNVKLKVGDRLIEIDILNEDPFIVGEVTTRIRSLTEAEAEVRRLVEKRRLAESFYGRKAEMTVLAVANVERNIVEKLRELAEKEGITLLVGRQIETLHLA